MRIILSRRFVRGAMGSALALLLAILATPRKASAYVDPGTGAMLWQALAAACIGSLFYARRVIMWAQRHVDFRSRRAMGFLFATAYGLVVSPLVCSLYRHGQVPRFGDVFVLGVMLTAYFFTWEGAAYLLGVGVLVSAWVLPPDGTLAVASAGNLYRLVSFAVVSVFLICLITRLKAGRKLVPQSHRMTVSRGAVGAD
jgi:hypothetical protein